MKYSVSTYKLKHLLLTKLRIDTQQPKFKIMEKKILLLLFLSILLFSCKEKEDPCELCDFRYRTCVEGECILQDDVTTLGGEFIRGNYFKGTVENLHPCLDTIVFSRNEGGPAGGISIYANVPPVRFIALGGQKLSDNEFLMGSSSPFCSVDGDGYMAQFRVRVEQDTAFMDMYNFILGQNYNIDTISNIILTK